MGASKLTESEYTTIKQLLAKGYEGQKVSELVGRGVGTVSGVKNSNSYEEFIGRGRAYRAARKERRATGQLPLDTPKPTTINLREELAVKVNALQDAIVQYKHSATGGNAVKQIRYYQKAQERLEEAWLWLKESF